MNQKRSFKLTNRIKELGPKLKWMLFSEIQDLKIGAKYLDFICPEKEQDQQNATQKIEAIVRESLIKEFSPEIQNMKSFDFLVDAVVHNIKKEQLKD